MLRAALAGVGALMLMAASPAAPELHTFTNNDGASFKGQVLSVAGEEVNIKREDGQTFRPKFSLFSKADQAYIHQWMVKNAEEHGTELFNIHAISSKGIATVTNDHEAHIATTLWPETYQLVIKNMTSATWTNLRVRYIIFQNEAIFGKKAPDNYNLKRITSSVEVDKLAGTDSKNMPLDKITLSSYIKIDNHIWGDGAPNALSDLVKGLWVRVYDADDTLLQEWISDPDIAKNERWTMPREAPTRISIPSVPANPFPAARGGTGRGN